MEGQSYNQKTKQCVQDCKEYMMEVYKDTNPKYRHAFKQGFMQDVLACSKICKINPDF